MLLCDVASSSIIQCRVHPLNFRLLPVTLFRTKKPSHSYIQFLNVILNLKDFQNYEQMLLRLLSLQLVMEVWGQRGYCKISRICRNIQLKLSRLNCTKYFLKYKLSFILFERSKDLKKLFTDLEGCFNITCWIYYLQKSLLCLGLGQTGAQFPGQMFSPG